MIQFPDIYLAVGCFFLSARECRRLDYLFGVPSSQRLVVGEDHSVVFGIGLVAPLGNPGVVG